MSEKVEVVMLGGAPIGIGINRNGVFEMLFNPVFANTPRGIPDAKKACDEFVRRYNAHGDLLAACKAMLKAYQEVVASKTVTLDPFIFDDGPPIELARAAIAKAANPVKA